MAKYLFSVKCLAKLAGLSPFTLAQDLKRFKIADSIDLPRGRGLLRLYDWSAAKRILLFAALRKEWFKPSVAAEMVMTVKDTVLQEAETADKRLSWGKTRAGIIYEPASNDDLFFSVNVSSVSRVALQRISSLKADDGLLKVDN